MIPIIYAAGVTAMEYGPIIVAGAAVVGPRIAQLLPRVYGGAATIITRVAPAVVPRAVTAAGAAAEGIRKAVPVTPRVSQTSSSILMRVTDGNAAKALEQLDRQLAKPAPQTYDPGKTMEASELYRRLVQGAVKPR